MALEVKERETKEMYQKRLDLQADAENEAKLAQKDSGWAAALDFFKSRMETAKRAGDPGMAQMYATLNNDFVRGHFTYVALGYEEMKKGGHLLTVEESRRQIRNAQDRLRRAKKKRAK